MEHDPALYKNCRAICEMVPAAQPLGVISTMVTAAALTAVSLSQPENRFLLNLFFSFR